MQLLSHLADGALRDGMSLLDQCASAGGGTITAETVERCLGLAGTRKAAQLLEAISRRDARAALEEFAALYAGGKDLAALLDEMACLARDILIVKTAPGGGLGMLSGVSETSQVLQLQNAFAEAELLRIIALLQQTAANFCKSQNPRVDCELCLLQLCLPQLQLDAQSLNARLSRVEEQLASGVLVQARPAAAPEAADAPPTEGPVHETASSTPGSPAWLATMVAAQPAISMPLDIAEGLIWLRPDLALAVKPYFEPAPAATMPSSEYTPPDHGPP